MATIDILKHKGIKVTKARIIIYDIISNSDVGISADFICKECLNEGININLSTIYRNLEVFEENDLIEKFDLGEGKYNYVIKKHNHKHILECSLCHKEVELQCPMQQIEQLVKTKTGFTLIEHELVMKGICEECKKK